MTDPDPVQDFIEHFGTKGMKWGVRKDRGSNSAATKLSTNARTNGKDAYPGLSTKSGNHAGKNLKTLKPKQKHARNLAMDYVTSGFARKARAHAARRKLKKLEGKSGNPDTRRGRKKQKKIDQAKLDAAFTYALLKPRKSLYVTQDMIERRVKGKKFVKETMTRYRRMPYEDIRIRPTPES
jgi:hypothetical protein